MLATKIAKELPKEQTAISLEKKLSPIQSTAPAVMRNEINIENINPNTTSIISI